MAFKNEVVGGGGELIRDSIHSRNYESGADGWGIFRDGFAEFFFAFFRGSITVLGTPGRINISSLEGVPTITFLPVAIEDSWASGQIKVETIDGGDRAQMFIQAPTPNSAPATSPNIRMKSRDIGTPASPRTIEFEQVDEIILNSTLGGLVNIPLSDVSITAGDLNIPAGRLTVPASIQTGSGVFGNGASVSTVQVNVNFPTVFPSPPHVMTNINSGSGTVARWISRAMNITTTGFTFFAFAPTATANTPNNVPFQWIAILP